MNRKIKVCHMTSAHPQEDIRIFHKECISLAKNGYEVYLVSCGKTYDKESVHIIGVGDSPKRRFTRMVKTAKKIFKKALELDADIYHFHDPELLPYGIQLKRKGKIVIFDSHEDVPGQIIDKYWIPRVVRRLISFLYKCYETYVVKRLDAVVTATYHIATIFENRAKTIVIINNYSKLNDITVSEKPFSLRERIICFAGGINEIRGESVLLNAMKKVSGKLILAGPRGESSELFSLENVDYIGQQPRKKVNELYGNSMAGIVIYQPAKNHYESQPIKLFEYMAAGLPCVASNFPLWREIVDGNGCGLCVDPTDADAVAKACNYLLDHPDKCQEFGKAGRNAVETAYNWIIEEKKLIKLYSSIIKVSE